MIGFVNPREWQPGGPALRMCGAGKAEAEKALWEGKAPLLLRYSPAKADSCGSKRQQRGYTAHLDDHPRALPQAIETAQAGDPLGWS